MGQVVSIKIPRTPKKRAILRGNIRCLLFSVVLSVAAFLCFSFVVYCTSVYDVTRTCVKHYQCSNCENKFYNWTQYCTACGDVNDSNDYCYIRSKCSTCEKPVNSNYAYCPTCGNPVNDGEYVTIASQGNELVQFFIKNSAREE